jgi:hypothetical protein
VSKIEEIFENVKGIAETEQRHGTGVLAFFQDPADAEISLKLK